jgi:hypothetical protein
MRLPLATDLVSRDGTVDQDAIIKNAYVELSGDQSAVFKRPGVNTASVDVTGAGQGGQANNGLVYVIFGDVVRSYNSSFVLQETINL